MEKGGKPLEKGMGCEEWPKQTHTRRWSAALRAKLRLPFTSASFAKLHPLEGGTSSSSQFWEANPGGLYSSFPIRKKGSGLAPMTNPRRRRPVVRQVCKSSGQLEAQTPLDPGAARRRWRKDAERAECGRAKPEPERGRRSRAGSGRAEMPYKLKKEKVSEALFLAPSLWGLSGSLGGA